MNASATPTINTVAPGSNVGVQTGNVHNSTIYVVPPDATPEQKYTIGLRSLEAGAPSKARGLIRDAIDHGLDHTEANFHWVLALLSKRTLRDLTSEEHEQIKRLFAALHTYLEDEWRTALEVVFRLLYSPNDSSGATAAAIKDLHALPPGRREMILRHLDLVLTGAKKDSVWEETRREAEESQCGAQRLDRVWAYFHADPIPARTREPDRAEVFTAHYVYAVACTGLFAGAVGYLGWLVLLNTAPSPILAYLVLLAAGSTAGRQGLEWHYRAKRWQARDRQLRSAGRESQPPEGGFARGVDHSFTHYFGTYLPQGLGREHWLSKTAGIRRLLRDEVVEIYRESRIGVRRVDWLIRFMARDVRQRWQAGTLLEYRDRYSVATSTKIWCLLPAAIAVASATVVIAAAFTVNPLGAVLAAVCALAAGWYTAVWWTHILGEKRREREEREEHDQAQSARKTEHQRWKAKLDATRPNEQEMEAWLTYDKTLLLSQALDLYRLPWQDVIAHTFLQTHAPGCKKARRRGGVWRFSKYSIRLFLVTHDGVRDFSADLNFERAHIDWTERRNFRFDAVSSIEVARESTYSYTLKLTLSNGPTTDVGVANSEGVAPEPEEDPDAFSETNLDAAGFTTTLHILEGIAAEGKAWFNRHTVDTPSQR
ncbi:hypothetical protein J4H86_05065 [Spiractinospora alimapuensis]|uniref:hypothetical protein n=1 Tax=Spiractinospora alimapuensis TaxID=2820884 RepID=UPI001F2764B2|nr:hypothetical protein [Spiractinospora alimapuensis]QVQ53160.1 hypothetical protein J4H86_05065 [Spiractinospora alimapuensis]